MWSGAISLARGSDFRRSSGRYVNYECCCWFSVEEWEVNPTLLSFPSFSFTPEAIFQEIDASPSPVSCNCIRVHEGRGALNRGMKRGCNVYIV